MAKIFRMDVLGADFGDSLWIEYGIESAPNRILVDGGTKGTFDRLKPLLEAVRSDTPSHELLIVTHVDEDHIGGSLLVLQDEQLAKQFQNVWFNGRHHLSTAAEEESFHGGHGELLSSAILKHKTPWNDQFHSRPVMRSSTDQPVEVTLPGGAKLTVLTPSAAQLVKLIPAWDKAVAKAGIAPTLVEVEPDVVDGEESFGLINVESLAAADTSEDTAPANGSSISTLVEYAGKRLLLAADAHPTGLIAGLKALNQPLPLKVDVFKLPHHGSKCNVTTELLELVDAKVIVFSTNGKKFHHPDREAVARVVKHYGKGVELVFNYRSNESGVWDESTLKDLWGYTTKYGASDQGISLHLA